MREVYKGFFASDNNASVHPKILKALEKASHGGHAPAYGDDLGTAKASVLFKDLFGSVAEVFFVFNGTAANVLGLKAMTEPHHAILCAESAHINEDECGAPERFTGCKLIPISHDDGKIRVKDLEPKCLDFGMVHRAQPKVISISQATEFGTVYSLEEIRALADFAHSKDMFLHVDGARLGNAAASLGVDFKQMITASGVDVLSFGGTKNGLLFGEAVVILRPELVAPFGFIRKQGMQLASKMRFLAAQFEALLEDGLWLENAQRANALARKLAEGISSVPKARVTRPVQANAVFARFEKPLLEKLQKDFYFYVWNEQSLEVRLMLAFDTPESALDALISAIKRG